MPAVAEALTARGVAFIQHRHQFRPDATDEEWLGHVVDQGWVILTRDAAIRHVELEREVIKRAGARQFVVRGGNMKADEVARVLDCRRRSASVEM